MPYRSCAHAVASALEEQRELLALERARKFRHVRVACTLFGLFVGFVGVIEFEATRPARPHYACHAQVRAYEPSAPGREPRPPDRWTLCAWEP